MRRKVLLIGWDAADWKVINPLMDSGKMPALEKLVNGGVVANLATLDPPLSPMLWTSIATGKTADKHGILSFSEPIPDKGGVRPVNNTSRKTRAIWNILHNKGYKSNVVGWWPSHPAEPINGCMVSNFFQQAGQEYGKPWMLMKDTIHPKEYVKELATLRVHPGEMTDAHILPFIPLAAEVDQEKDKALSSVAKILAHASSVQAASTWLMENSEWDFMAVYFDAIDHFGHGFMKFHPPRQEHINKDVFERYKGVIEGGYIFHDMMLERLLKLAGEDVTVMLVSDHGFHSDHLRPKALPKLPAAPAYEHSPYGILCLNGPGIKKDERIFGASLLDVTPTLLSLFGLPVGADMDGKVLLNAFEDVPETEVIKSWDEESGDFGEHPESAKEDAFASAEAMKQLIELGYIEDPGDDKNKAIEQARLESQYNLSRVMQSKRDYQAAIKILEAEHLKHPDDIRLALDLAKCLVHTGKYEEAKEALEACRKTEYGKIPVLDFLEGVIQLNQGNSTEALNKLEKVEALDPRLPELHLHIGKVYLQIHNYIKAESAFSKAIEIDENSATSHLGLGISVLRQGRYLESLDHLLNSIGLIYHFPVAHYHLGEALFHLEKFRESSEAFEVCLTMAPKLIKARRFLLKLYSEHIVNPDKLRLHREVLNQRMRGSVVIVSGLPRSGTSLMMQMLDAGGMPVLSDGERKADNSNPGGYFELEAVKKSVTDTSWLENAVDKAVKVIAPLLRQLPNNYDFKVIFMERDIKEVMLSQQKMLNKAQDYNIALAQAFEKEVEKVRELEKQQPNMEILYVPYANLVRNPDKYVYQVADFCAYPLHAEKMKEMIDPTLYRNRISKNE